MTSDESLAPVSAAAAPSVGIKAIHVAETKYRLVRQLGAGGMAVVHLAAIERGPFFSRNVALKVIHEHHAADNVFNDLFAQEASLAAKLTHPNIVGVFDYCQNEDGGPFLVMEWVNGISLRKVLLQDPPMPFAAISFVMAEVLRGLGYAHELPNGAGIRGLLHRDLSPHNILLSWEGAVKLSDFGISKALTTTSGAVTGNPNNGKPSYMSPEQVGHEQVDRRSDLFSLGVVFWEMLAGRKLFTGSHSEVFQQILSKSIPPPSVKRSVPRDLERVAMKMLERKRERRYERAEDALADLLQCRDATSDGAGELVRMLATRFPVSLRSESDVALEPGTASGAEPSSAEQLTLADGILPPRSLRRGRRLAWATVVVATAVAVAFVLALRLRKTEEPRAPAARNAGSLPVTMERGILPVPSPTHSGKAAPSAKEVSTAPLPAVAAGEASKNAGAVVREAPRQPSHGKQPARPKAALPPAAPPAAGIREVSFDQNAAAP